MNRRAITKFIMVRGCHLNHVLHLILTIYTVGFWPFVWLFLILFTGERRLIVSVDEFGNLRNMRV